MAHLNLGLALAAQGRRDEALEVQLGVLRIDDDGTKDPRTHAVTQISAGMNAGKLLLEMGRAEEAYGVLQEAEREVQGACFC